MKLTKAKIKKFNEDKIKFFRTEIIINQNRVRQTTDMVEMLEMKVREHNCKANTEALEQMQSRLEILRAWVDIDSEKIKYYKLQL